MAFSLNNIVGHKASTFAGLLTGALQAALMGAAQSFATTGNVTNWQQYALAGAAAAAPVIVGGLYAPAATAAPVDDPKAALIAKVDAALTAAAQQAMEAEAAKITGQLQG